MPGLKIPKLQDVIAGDLAINGDWVLANVETTMSWPVQAQKVRFLDLDIWIIPLTEDHYPAIAARLPSNISRAEAEKRLLRFLSALCWVEGAGALVGGVGGGNLPRPNGRSKQFGYSIRKEFELEYLPVITEHKPRLALAIMREGRGTNDPVHAFVSFYRILELGVTSQRDEWINAHLGEIRDIQATQALTALKAGVANIGAHLRESGRNAASHARIDPVIDPDDPADTRRLWAELPVMEAIAEFVIEKELGVETSHTVWKKHLYELAGFKTVFGMEIVEPMRTGADIAGEPSVDMPHINVEISGHPPYEPLNNLRPMPVERVGPHQVLFTAKSEDNQFGIQFVLDFREERLNFHIDTGIHAQDDGSAKAAEGMSEIGRFIRDYYMNGKLVVRNADTGEIIGRKDAFIPMNIIVNPDGFNAGIEEWKEKARQRKA